MNFSRLARHPIPLGKRAGKAPCHPRGSRLTIGWRVADDARLLRRLLLKRSLAIVLPCALLAVTVQAKDKKAPPPPFTVLEATIPDMQKALAEKRITSRELVQQYLGRIATYNDRLNATLAVNPKALEEADALDRERAQRKLRGPLHGIPIAIKDNIHTTDMPTTGGALVFDGYVPPYEATLTKNLRDAGAIIIAKTGMTELANWVAGAPYPMPDELQRAPRLRHEPVRPAARSARGHVRWTAGPGHGRLQLGGRHRRELLGGQRRHRDQSDRS